MLSRPSSSVSSPESGSSGAGQPAARSSPSAASSASRSASATSWCTGRVTARPPWPGCGSRSPRHEPRTAPTSLPVRPGPAATRHGRPGSGPPLPPARLDPLADRHPPNLASSVQETGRCSGADRSVVTSTPSRCCAAGMWMAWRCGRTSGWSAHRVSGHRAAAGRWRHEVQGLGDAGERACLGPARCRRRPARRDPFAGRAGQAGERLARCT